ncbi:hypothetical protein [Shewanella sp. UCD-KL21]|uniref:hypothetical protein n=1 Tax=Shewanella sp. UCD-KL21 TaxID=1917164 RepID=UPI000970B375|nr:hypothetical protein [Shewanella sp. UCD-KL21]
MSINATLLGQLLTFLWVPFIIFITWMSYKLGKSKTSNPKTISAIGFLLSFMPPLALIFIAVLALKSEPSITNSSI